MRNKILDSSTLLFEQKGYSETSINDIIEHIGITKGGFYYHFESKQQLLMEIFSQFIDNLLKDQEIILSNPDADCKTKLFEIIKLAISNIGRQGKGAQIFFRQMNYLDEKGLVEIGQKRDLFRLRVKNLLEQGIRDKEFRGDLRTDIVSLGILGICNWSYFWFDATGSVSDEDVSRIYTEMIVNGLAFDYQPAAWQE